MTLIIRDGIVREEFIDLARTEGRTAEQDARLEVLKQDMADRLLSRSAVDVYDVEVGAEVVIRS